MSPCQHPQCASGSPDSRPAGVIRGYRIDIDPADIGLPGDRLFVYPVVQGRVRRLFPDGFEVPQLSCSRRRHSAAASPTRATPLSDPLCRYPVEDRPSGNRAGRVAY